MQKTAFAREIAAHKKQYETYIKKKQKKKKTEKKQS